MKFEWGNALHLTVEGASHAPEILMSLSGLPAGVPFDEESLVSFMKRRRPSSNASSTTRVERDIPIISSGISEKRLNGDTINVCVKNEGFVSSAYEKYKNIPRPSHADYTAYVKYKDDYDYRGGGHLSGRMTVALCAAGGFCLQYLKTLGITVGAHILSVGSLKDTPYDPVNITAEDITAPLSKKYPLINTDMTARLDELFIKTAAEKDSVGGVIECCVLGIKPGVGEPVFDSVESVISHLLFSVPAVKGVAFGSGFDAAGKKGSENNDGFYIDGGTVKTYTNNHGGILGGITSGMPIIFTAAIKPTPTIGITQKSVDLINMKNCEITSKGMHDVCIVPRAVPCIESCAALALTELILSRKSNRE